MSNSLRLPRKMHFMSENEHGTCTRALSRKRERRGHHFMRACAVEMDMRNSKSHFCASRPTQTAAPTRANPDLNPLNSYCKNPLVRSTIWGIMRRVLGGNFVCANPMLDCARAEEETAEKKTRKKRGQRQELVLPVMMVVLINSCYRILLAGPAVDNLVLPARRVDLQAEWWLRSGRAPQTQTFFNALQLVRHNA